MKSQLTQFNLLHGRGVEKERTKHSALLSSRVLWVTYILCLVLNDIIMTLVAFNTAFVVRFELGLPFFQLDVVPSAPYYSSLTLLLVPTWLIIFAGVGLYKPATLLGGTDEYSKVSRATTIGLMTLILAGFLQPAFIIARGWLLLAWFFSFFFVAFGRFLLRRVVYAMRRQGYFLSPTVIVGANDEGISLARQLNAWRTSGLVVIGFVDKKFKPGTVLPDGLPVLGSTDQLDEVIAGYGVRELVLASSAISSHDKMLEIFQRYGVSGPVNVRMSSGLYEIITTGLTVKEFAYVPLVGVNKVRLTGVESVFKTIMDYVVTISVMVVAAPLLFLLGLAIKLDSPGPVLHRRRVKGVNGREFDAFKFRTMVVNGDEVLAQHPELQAELARNHKLKHDPRVTRVGRWLRKFSLDELPQLLNVLKRDMSLVGPRMISPDEIAQYNQWDINLLTVRPGLTGLWQVSGRSDLTYEDRVRLDMHYIRNWSIWLDLQILMRTIPVVLGGHGAY